MKAILHIGIEKTGTTSIQNFLHKNRHRLADHGIFYPQSPGLRNHRAIAAVCLNEDRRDDYFISKGITTVNEKARWKTQFLREFDRELKSNRDSESVLISSEHLSSRLVSTEEVSRLKVMLDKYCESTDVHVYLRRQDRVAISLRSTAIRAGHTPPSGFPTTLGISNRYDYEALLRRWAEVFGQPNVFAYDYDKSVANSGDIVSDFLNRLGLDKTRGLLDVERQNTSMSDEAQALALIVNNHLPKIVSGSPAEWSIVRNNILDKLAEHGGSRPTADRASAVAFVSQFEDTNMRVAAKWFGGDLFDSHYERYPESLAPVTLSDKDYEYLIRILCSCIKAQYSGNSGA